MKIRIGTRRSRLAMWQAEHVAARLAAAHPDLELEIIPVQTSGDLDRSTALSEFGRTGIFTKEIEDALLNDECDIGVNSYKDVATRIPDGLTVGAVLEREDPRDAFVSRDGRRFVELESGCLIGTSSLRRRAMLLHNRDDLQIRDLRGNVPSRLRAVGLALDEGKEWTEEPLDGVILALAGVRRLGLEAHVTEILETADFLPAPAQGAIAVEMRSGDQRTGDLIQCLEHPDTRMTTTAERKFLQTLEGGCQLPIGALAIMEDRGVTLKGMVLNLDGSRFVLGIASGPNPKEVGVRLAEDLRRRGGGAILEEVAAAHAAVPN